MCQKRHVEAYTMVVLYLCSIKAWCAEGRREHSEIASLEAGATCERAWRSASRGLRPRASVHGEHPFPDPLIPV
jgi:hypothetical protein